MAVSSAISLSLHMQYQCTCMLSAHRVCVNTLGLFLPCARMHSRVMCLVTSVCVCIYNYIYIDRLHFRYILVNFRVLTAMLVHHKCTVTIEENAFLQCFAAMQAASVIWLANSISACIHIIIRNVGVLIACVTARHCKNTFSSIATVHLWCTNMAVSMRKFTRIQQKCKQSICIYIYIFMWPKKLTYLAPYRSKKHW